MSERAVTREVGSGNCFLLCFASLVGVVAASWAILPAVHGLAVGLGAISGPLLAEGRIFWGALWLVGTVLGIG